jgi:hypothetical protein
MFSPFGLLSPLPNLRLLAWNWTIFHAIVTLYPIIEHDMKWMLVSRDLFHLLVIQEPEKVP